MLANQSMHYSDLTERKYGMEGKQFTVHGYNNKADSESKIYPEDQKSKSYIIFPKLESFLQFYFNKKF